MPLNGKQSHKWPGVGVGRGSIIWVLSRLEVEACAIQRYVSDGEAASGRRITLGSNHKHPKQGLGSQA